MRVLFIISSYLPDIGGHEMYAHEIARRLVRDGHAVDVITGSRSDHMPGEPVPAPGGEDILNGVHVYRAHRAGVTRGMLWRMARLGRAHKYDVVHSIGEGVVSQVATVGKGVWHWPHLITIQGGILQRGFRPGMRERLDRAAIGFSLRHASRVHAISRTLADAASALGARHIAVIPNGVDEAVFRPLDRATLRQKHGVSPEQKVVVVVSRLIPRKGIAYAVRAVAQATKTHPGLRLIIIGEGPQRQELEKLIKSLDLDGRVRMTGWVPHDQLPEYLSMADLFISTPDFEGLGIVFIEALASGVPTIGSNVGGILDVIEDGRNGLLVAPGDLPALASAMTRLLADEELRRRFTQEGLATVQAKFRWESVYEQTAAIYQDMLASRAAS